MINSKKIISALSAIAVVFALLCGCSAAANESEALEQATGGENESSNQSDSYESGAEAKLSDECDFVLAVGIDNAGNKYELVANTAQTFEGTNKIGVIKNNEWFVELSSDCPFIDESGEILGVTPGYDSHDYYVNEDGVCGYIYIGNNCFGYSEGYLFDCNVLWNAKTKAVHSYPAGKYSTSYILSTVAKNDGENDFSQNGVDEEYVLFHDTDTYKLLNTTTMTFDSSFKDIGYSTVNPYSEGLLFATTKDDKFGFFDKSGNLKIDFEKYSEKFNLGSPTPRYFQNGTFKFNYPNSSGIFFEITIDKNGNVISEVSEMETKNY